MALCTDGRQHRPSKFSRRILQYQPENSFISIGHLAVLKFMHFKMPGFLNVNVNNNNTLF